MPRKRGQRKKSNPSQSKAPRAPRRRQRRGGVMSGPRARSLTGDLAMSLIDPWTKSACIPDGSNGTGCFSVKQVVSLGTGAGGGAACFLLNPQSLKNFSLTDSGSVNTTLTVTGNYAAALAQSTIGSLYQSCRPVSAGIRVTYVSNTQTDQGILLIGQVSDQVAPGSFNAATLSTAQALMQNYKIFPLRSGGRVTWRPQSMDDTMVFSSTAGSTAGVTTPPNVPWLLVAVFGATASTTAVALLDVVVNFEGQYNSQTFLPGGIEQVAKPAESGWYETALNAVRRIEQVVPFVASTMTNAMNSPVASTAMGMLFNAADRRGLPQRRIDYGALD